MLFGQYIWGCICIDEAQRTQAATKTHTHTHKPAIALANIRGERKSSGAKIYQKIQTRKISNLCEQRGRTKKCAAMRPKKARTAIRASSARFVVVGLFFFKKTTCICICVYVFGNGTYMLGCVCVCFEWTTQRIHIIAQNLLILTHTHMDTHGHY